MIRMSTQNIPSKSTPIGAIRNNGTAETGAEEVQLTEKILKQMENSTKEEQMMKEFTNRMNQYEQYIHQQNEVITTQKKQLEEFQDQYGYTENDLQEVHDEMTKQEWKNAFRDILIFCVLLFVLSIGSVRDLIVPYLLRLPYMVSGGALSSFVYVFFQCALIALVIVGVRFLS